MKIGNNDYTPPFWWDLTDEGWFIADSFGSKEPDDGEGDQVAVDDILSALNELASLRQERDELKREIQEAVEILRSAEECLKAEFGPNEILSDADMWLKRNTTPGGGE